MTSTLKARVLVIDDEAQILRLLRHSLEAQGYEVHEAKNGLSGLKKVVSLQPDAIILDLSLPDLDGLKVLDRLREWPQIPVLILSVRDSVNDITAALDAGADDYLTKPFHERELLSRVRAILRRSQVVSEPAVERFGDIEVDPAARLVRRGGEEVHLTAKEYAMLLLLVQHRGRVVTHQYILRALWGPDAEEDTNYLRAYIIRLRQKLEANPSVPQYLITEPRIGYRLVED
jgi:two-component system, OmpR family, KDP operon response regulator KdpE